MHFRSFTSGNISYKIFDTLNLMIRLYRKHWQKSENLQIQSCHRHPDQTTRFITLVVFDLIRIVTTNSKKSAKPTVPSPSKSGVGVLSNKTSTPLSSSAGICVLIDNELNRLSTRFNSVRLVADSSPVKSRILRLLASRVVKLAMSVVVMGANATCPAHPK